VTEGPDLSAIARKPRILCVDDEPRVLEGLVAFLRRRFRVVTAHSGAEAIELLQTEEPFELVMSDMRMPGMDGAAFLAAAREISPDATRLLLTGHAELSAAMKAVNQGGIFRFLTKPCPPAQLLGAVQDGCRHHQLKRAERELLEQTLKGAVSVLTEVMSLAAPLAFGRANRIQRSVRWVIEELKLPEKWQYELAAMFSQIGLIGVDEAVLERDLKGRVLSPAEAAQLAGHAEVARRLLQQIPRLGPVAAMVGNHMRSAPLSSAMRAMERGEPEVLGAHVLRVAVDLDRRVQAGETQLAALEEMRQTRNVYNPAVVEALRTVVQRHHCPVGEVALDDLEPGMVLLEDIRTQSGVVVVPKGHEITKTVKARLMRFAQGRGIREPIRVQFPELPAEAEPIALDVANLVAG